MERNKNTSSPTELDPSVPSSHRPGAYSNHRQTPYHSSHHAFIDHELAPCGGSRSGNSRKISEQASKIHRLPSRKCFSELIDSLNDHPLVIFHRSRTETPRPCPAPMGVFCVIVDGGHCNHWGMQQPCLPVCTQVVSSITDSPLVR